LEAQPARATLYTAKDDIARKYSRPMSRSETRMAGAMGITAKDASVVIMMIAGAMTKIALSANGAIQFSLVKNLQHVTMTCSTPNGPARLGRTALENAQEPPFDEDHSAASKARRRARRR